LPTTISKRDFDREFNAVARSLPPGRWKLRPNGQVKTYTGK
jgi:hypothetical protein